MEKDIKLYILEHLNNFKLLRSKHFAASIINYDPYIDNKFTLEYSTYNFNRQIINVINSKPSVEISKDILMSKYNQLLMDKYSDTTFLIRQITKQHQKTVL